MSTTIYHEPKVWLMSHTFLSDDFYDIDTINEIEEYVPNFKGWFEKAIETDASDGEIIIELAGRNCYHSWLNKSGRDNKAYINNIIKQEHYSVLEHASAGFLIYADRSITHELVRHRHQSFSQESTRYVSYYKGKEPSFIVPELFMETEEDRATVEEYFEAVKKMYLWAHEKATERFGMIKDGTMRRKLVRQEARKWIPHALSATIVVTGNYRAWFESLPKRLSYTADVGIRQVYLQILKHLEKLAPHVFGGRFEIKTWEDGTKYAELV